VGHTAQDVGYRSEEVVGEIRRGRIAMKMEVWRLRQLQSLSLNAKVARTERKIREWYNHWQGDVYVAFSGGKDSTVLLHIVRKLYPDVPAVFCDTGLEYPEIRDFVSTFENVVWLKPKLTFKETLEKYGYPVISKEQAQCIYEHRHHNVCERRRRRDLEGHGNKGRRRVSLKWQHLITEAPFEISHKCCDVMKKRPMNAYSKETGRVRFVGTMAGDSSLRQQLWVKNGCNALTVGRPYSAPLSHWLEEDIWEYLHTRNVPYSSIYDKGYDRTGCMFCMFGVHMEKGENRFQRMKKTHPAQWRYCMDKLGLRKVLEYIGVPYE
jgi:3'-phosphoadenosine 5'-phosphosulfate sulfotransferase (PAPS reductase)/FAD synthetase